MSGIRSRIYYVVIISLIKYNGFSKSRVQNKRECCPNSLLLIVRFSRFPGDPNFDGSSWLLLTIFYKLLNILHLLFLIGEHPCPFASVLPRRPFRGSQAGNTCLFRPLKGRLSPSCSPSMGTPPLQEFTLRDNSVLQKLWKLQNSELCH